MTVAVCGRQRLRPADRVRRRSDYSRCYRRGRRWHGQLLELVAVRNEDNHPRMGTTISRRVGKAVERNRIRRHLKEWFRSHPDRAQWPSFDFVFHVRPTARGAERDALLSEAEQLIARLQSQRRSR